MVDSCCLLSGKDIHYRTLGNMILLYKKDTSLGCQRGWTGDNCDSRSTNFETDGECSRCRTGWTGQDCDECATNFGPDGQCDQCIRGWAEKNCSECAINFEPSGQCNSSLVGWVGDNCDACALRWTGQECDACERFGFSSEIGCTECIVNGVLRGTSLYVDVSYNITSRMQV